LFSSPRRSTDLERETGIEPATNSLEGCDSTTELLPPSRRPLRCTLRRASPPSRLTNLPLRRGRHRLRASPIYRISEHSACQPDSCSERSWLASRSSRSERRLVGRGGFEPPKPLGRQIYSLLRLTAPQPPRVRPPLASPEERRLSRPGVLFVDLRVVRLPADRVRVRSRGQRASPDRGAGEGI
jgi:hypothetical protein